MDTNFRNVKRGGGGAHRILSIASITSQKSSIMTPYIPGSGVGATSVFARRAKMYRANSHPPAPVGTIPGSPTSVSAVAGDSSATISFAPPLNNGGTPITSYLVISNPGGITAVGSSSPITISGLTNGTPYTFTVIARNSVGPSPSSSPSSSITPISAQVAASVPDAPVLVSVSSKTDTTITLTFTQTSNGSPAITNYKYSVNGGATYTAFSPVDTTSPATITGLTMNTTYDIRLRAVNINGDSQDSNQITETTPTVNYARFTTAGAATWTAPEGVNQVEYLVVGGGGGGGSTYSDIEVIGAVPFQAYSPGPGQYWISSTNVGYFYGYLYKGGSRYTSTKPVRLTAPQVIVPSNVSYAYNKWYDFDLVYWNVSSGTPTVSNVAYVQYPIASAYSAYFNNDSAGSGGGGGGYIRTSSIYPLSKYTVVPGTTYNLYVGAGGAGAIGSAGIELYGASGEASYFDTITAAGGVGGSPSRVGFYRDGGGGQGSGNIMGGKGGAGGSRNGGPVQTAGNYQWNTTVSGTSGGFGANINFDGSGTVTYGAGGDGGDANTASSSIAPANTGKGGKGTGAVLNSYSSGMDGASGIVILKYYT